MIPKGKDSGVKLKHGISFPQYLLSALGKKGGKNTTTTASTVI